MVIIGGGYTGMWTAYFLSERAPGTRIVLLEQDICGGGPSGRNGGFVHGWWEVLPYLVERYGPERGLEVARAADEVVDGIGDWCAQHGVDAWFRKAGYLRGSRLPGAASGFERTARDDDPARCPGAAGRVGPRRGPGGVRLPGFRDGLLMPSAASVQPARLARGLRRVLIERGVVIYEGTRVRRMETATGAAATPGSQRSGSGPMAERSAPTRRCWPSNAWAAGWPGHRMRLLAWGSYMVVTEPIPDRLAALGWTGGELLERHAVHDQLLPDHP